MSHSMVRTYKSSMSNHRNGKNHYPYFSYSPQSLKSAIESVRKGCMTANAASKVYNIPRNTLYRHLQGTMKQDRPGHPQLLSSVIEDVLIDQLNLVSEWSFPFDEYDLRMLAKMYLDERRIEIPQLKDNFPGVDWAKHFMKRHKGQISGRLASNISRRRAAVTASILDEFFMEATDIKDVPPQNLINYDETNLTDNPGLKKFIFKRGCKYPERVVNSNPKSAISLMYSGTASGHLFPPYVVYKSSQLWTSWTEGGPTGTR